MKGKELHRLVKLSDLTAEAVASKFGISKQALYDLFKKDEIGEYYDKKAEKAGLITKEQESSSVKNTPVPASKWMEMWESAEKERKDTLTALLQFMDSHNKLLASHDQLLGTHQALLKTKLKISS